MFEVKRCMADCVQLFWGLVNDTSHSCCCINLFSMQMSIWKCLADQQTCRAWLPSSMLNCCRTAKLSTFINSSANEWKIHNQHRWFSTINKLWKLHKGNTDKLYYNNKKKYINKLALFYLLICCLFNITCMSFCLIICSINSMIWH